MPVVVYKQFTPILHHQYFFTGITTHQYRTPILHSSRAIVDQLSGVAGLRPLLLHLKERCAAARCKLLVLYVYHRQQTDMPDDLLQCLKREVVQDYRYKGWVRGLVCAWGLVRAHVCVWGGGARCIMCAWYQGEY